MTYYIIIYSAVVVLNKTFDLVSRLFVCGTNLMLELGLLN